MIINRAQYLIAKVVVHVIIHNIVALHEFDETCAVTFHRRQVVFSAANSTVCSQMGEKIQCFSRGTGFKIARYVHSQPNMHQSERNMKKHLIFIGQLGSEIQLQLSFVHNGSVPVAD